MTARPKQLERRPLRIQLRPVLTGQLGRTFLGISASEIGNVAATLLILRAVELLAPSHGHNSATKIALGLYVAYNAAVTITSIPAGRLGDRSGKIRVMAMGVAAFAVAYIGLLVGSSITALALLFVAAGIGIGCVETAEHAAVAEQAPPSLRGSAFGALAGVQSLGNFAASATAGLLWTTTSARAAFSYIAGWMLLSLLIVCLSKPASVSERSE